MRRLLFLFSLIPFTVNVNGKWLTPDSNGKICYNEGSVVIDCEIRTSRYDLAEQGIIEYGKLIFEEVTGWAELFFEPEHNLMSLLEPDSFVRKIKIYQKF